MKARENTMIQAWLSPSFSSGRVHTIDGSVQHWTALAARAAARRGHLGVLRCVLDPFPHTHGDALWAAALNGRPFAARHILEMGNSATLPHALRKACADAAVGGPTGELAEIIRTSILHPVKPRSVFYRPPAGRSSSSSSQPEADFKLLGAASLPSVFSSSSVFQSSSSASSSSSSSSSSPSSLPSSDKGLQSYASEILGAMRGNVLFGDLLAENLAKMNVSR